LVTASGKSIAGPPGVVFPGSALDWKRRRQSASRRRSALEGEVSEVSVVIPAYNAAGYLSASIASALEQAGVLEILVVDDGSTDDTERVAAPFGPPVRVIQQANRGVGAARNRGIEESRGRYVAFLDADDTWLPGKLAKQLDALRGVPSCGLCYSAFTVVGEGLEPLEIRRSVRRASTLEDLLTRGNVVGSICTVLCERRLLEQAGGFDEALSQCADWDMWVRLAGLTEFLYVDEPLATYRLHGGNMSRNARLLESDSLRVLEKGFGLPGLPAGLRKKRRSAFARNDMVLAGTYFHARLWRDALRCAARGLRRDPVQVTYFLRYPLRLIQRGSFRPRALR
jgi:glycosyltransferase involved in cell wall biosynthesis